MGEPEVNLEGQSFNAEPDDWFSEAAAASSEAGADGADNQESVESIANREIKLWRMRAVPLGSDLCPLLEWRSAVRVCPWLGSDRLRWHFSLLASAAPEAQGLSVCFHLRGTPRLRGERA